MTLSLLRCRSVRYAHVLSVSCEAIMLSLTLVKLFCDFQEPMATSSPAKRRCAPLQSSCTSGSSSRFLPRRPMQYAELLWNSCSYLCP